MSGREPAQIGDQRIQGEIVGRQAELGKRVASQSLGVTLGYRAGVREDHQGHSKAREHSQHERLRISIKQPVCQIRNGPTVVADVTSARIALQIAGRQSRASRNLHGSRGCSPPTTRGSRHPGSRGLGTLTALATGDRVCPKARRADSLQPEHAN